MAASSTTLDSAGQEESTTSSSELEPEGDAVRVLKPRRAAPADAVRPTRAEINLGALRHNLRVLRRALGGAPQASGSSPAIWGVLKADAYGHGAPAIARTLERTGIDAICVALLEEGLELRSAGITAPVIVMGGYYGPHHRGLEDAIESDLTPVLYEGGQLERLGRIASARGRERVRFHLKVDTNMGRLGARPSEISELLDRADATPGVELYGLMSHLACADAADPQPTLVQLRALESVRRSARERGIVPTVCHVANSAGALAFPSARFDAIRPGIALYGISPFFGRGPSLPEELQRMAGELRPAMRVRTEVVALRTLEDGDRLGYGHTWVASGRRRIATVPMGYADGLSRAMSNRGSVLVRGRRAPIAGIVSMDLTTIDVTDVPDVRLGEEVVFLGSQDAGPGATATITAEEIAELAGTIPWEVVTSISRRVPRFYREP
ncbi:MAG: alanine racemase [Polyangiaceae bacterium]|jgi:alanine racemase|nr:alanine racemase [Polyangiaceae bacterium]